MEEQKKPVIRDKWGYISARAVYTTVNNMLIPIYLLYFFTEVFGLNIAVAGAMTALVRIIGAVSNIIAAYIIDHTNTKFGQVKPYLLLGIPVGILLYFLFTVPDLAGNLKTTYAYVIYILFSVSAAFYGAANALMMARISDDGAERNKVASVYGIVLGVLSFVLTVWCTAIISALGGGNVQLGFSIFAAILGVVIIVSSIMTIRVKEKVKITPQKVNLKTDLKAIFKNKYGLLFILAYIGLSSGINLVGAMVAYVAAYLIGNADSIMIIYACVLIMYPILSALYVPILKKVNKAQMMFVFSILTVIGTLVRFFNPASLVICILGCVAMVLIDNTLMVHGSLIISETVDEVELKYGVRSESTMFSLMGLISSLIYSGVLTLATSGLDKAGYVSGAATQSAEACAALNAWFNIPMLIGAAICAVCMIFMNRFAKKYPEIKRQLLEKRAALAAEAAPVPAAAPDAPAAE